MNFKELESDQKLRGGYYTPMTISKYLTDWVLEKNPETLLEPSCGDGSFFTNLTPINSSSLKKVVGIELLFEESQKAQKILKSIFPRSKVVNSDFFNWYINEGQSSSWDAVVGNPPYIRYQYFDKGQRDAAEFIYKKHGLKFTKMTNAWVPFVIASVSMLVPGGRLAMVVPTELLYIHHAKELRKFLEKELEHIAIVNFSEIVFEGTLQGTILLMGQKRSSDCNVAKISAKTGQLEIHSEELSTSFKVIDIKNENCLSSLSFDEINKFDYWDNSISQNQNWMYKFLTHDEADLIDLIIKRKNVFQFKDIAKVDIGIVTGANSYFVIDKKISTEYDLCEITKPMFAKSDLIKGITYTLKDHEENSNNGKNVHFIEFPRGKKLKNKKWLKYIEKGESEELHKRYKCRIRDPWWDVPYIWTSEIGLLKRCYLYPRLVLNEAGAYSTDTAYRIRIKDDSKFKANDLVASFINSLTFIFAELNGRSYGGGVLELVPSDIENLFIPIIKIKKNYLNQIDKMIRNQARLDELLNFADEVILKDGIGLTDQEIARLRALHERLLMRRLRTEDTSILH